MATDAPTTGIVTGPIAPALGIARKGRRIHDLRHTAACLWLARGVDAATVQAWMGHASIATTNIYLHHMGTGADRAGLDRLNAPGHLGARQRPIRHNFQERRNPPS